MMKRTELNLEAAEKICGGRDVTIEEIKKECKKDPVALYVVNICEKIHDALKSLGFKNIYHLEIND